MKKVLLAMSGGVDSTMAAAILKERGYCVKGVFFRLHPNFQKAEEEAREAAQLLNIDFCVFDFQKEFKQKIVDYFIEAHKKGLTPNPCVVCNKEVKFSLLFDNLKKQQADYLATGHYVILKDNQLFSAKDKSKDQSYFLWRLNQKILKKAIFPNGEYFKEDLKKAAQKLGLKRTESQEICFINTDIEEFLRKKLGSLKGKIIDTEGRVLASHEGLWFYTIGQRKRIGLAQGPYYVLRKDVKNNNLVVSKREEDLLSSEVKFKQANWILKKPKLPLRVEAKVRYRHNLSPGVLKARNLFVFDQPQKAVTPGQSIVFYQKDRLLGGGAIT